MAVFVSRHAKWAALAVGLIGVVSASMGLAQEPVKSRDWISMSLQSGHCAASTTSDTDTFALVGDASGNVEMHLVRDGWNLPSGRSSVRLVISDKFENIYDQVSVGGDGIVIAVPPTQTSRALMKGLMAGRSVSLLSGSGTLLRTFSLLGSGQAFRRLNECLKGLIKA